MKKRQDWSISLHYFFYEFKNQMPERILIKMQIILWICDGYKKKDIKKKLQDIQNTGKYRGEVIAPYLHKNYVQLSRLFNNCDTPEKVVSNIHKAELIKIILKKYENPLDAGYPTEEGWSPVLMQNYIHELFDLPQKVTPGNHRKFIYQFSNQTFESALLKVRKEKSKIKEANSYHYLLRENIYLLTFKDHKNRRGTIKKYAELWENRGSVFAIANKKKYTGSQRNKLSMFSILPNPDEGKCEKTVIMVKRKDKEILSFIFDAYLKSHSKEKDNYQMKRYRWFIIEANQHIIQNKVRDQTIKMKWNVIMKALDEISYEE